MPPSPNTRRWPRFSLRVLLFVVVLLVAVAFGLLRNWIAAKHREELARQWMLDHGGSIGQFNGWEIERREWWVRGLSFVVPRDCLYTVRYVNFERADDSTLARFRDLPHIREIHFSGCRITDAGLAHLRHLQRLEQIDVKETAIGDAGLAHLQHNREVQHFWLSDTKITDASLPFIAKNRGVTHLGLDGTAVTVDGVALLASLSEIETLTLSNTKVTPAVLQTIQQLPKLKHLSLRGIPLDDSHVPALASLKLVQLDVRQTQITARGAAELRRTVRWLEH